MKARFPVVLVAAAILTACATVPVETEPDEIPAEQPALVQEPEPEPTPEEPPAAEPETEYEVSQEIYDRTHEEIDELIARLNHVISSNDYEGWLRYLSRDYIDNYNSPETLNEINQYPQLKDNGIVLENLNDYFDWVVVPSRSRAVLKDIVFVDENKVIAYSSYSGKRARLYQFEKIEGQWKISEWE